jgi:hypothetical protein
VAVADMLHVGARVLRSPALRRAADAYDRAARVPYGRIPECTDTGNRLRLLARGLGALGTAPRSQEQAKHASARRSRREAPP